MNKIYTSEIITNTDEDQSISSDDDLFYRIFKILNN